MKNDKNGRVKQNYRNDTKVCGVCIYELNKNNKKKFKVTTAKIPLTNKIIVTTTTRRKRNVRKIGRVIRRRLFS